MAIFHSRYQGYSVGLRTGNHVHFTNGRYQTDDADEILMLREIVALEARGSRAVTEVADTYGAASLTGKMTLAVNDLPEKTFHLFDVTIEDLAMQIAAYVTSLPGGAKAPTLEDVLHAEAQAAEEPTPTPVVTHKAPAAARKGRALAGATR